MLQPFSDQREKRAWQHKGLTATSDPLKAKPYVT